MARKDRRERSELLALSSVGLMFPLCIAIGYYIGSTLDRWFGTGTKLMMLFVVLGIVAAFLNLFKEVANYNRATQQDKDKDQKPGDEGPHESQK
ncbi:MAG: AtpZ/AtpI family protein [Acidobacteriia bacterium]|nr:AtpZ/AtpI family protein [Terriglobia bacterium]